ncbi:hypothetical protein RSK20926_10129 [Roseobacter sp. SK209-2-6]|nr:hypothetical protein RSK20926_10129 [Roseobacter sp. SK209-2-6]
MDQRSQAALFRTCSKTKPASRENSQSFLQLRHSVVWLKKNAPKDATARNLSNL